MKKLLGWLILSAGLVALVWYLTNTNPTFREVFIGGFGLLASIFTSPFILEASLALICLVIVLTYNQRKLDREGKDEWIIMEKEPPPADTGSPTEESKR
jgi:hypothetical protein